MFKDFAIISIILLVGLQDTSAVQYYAMPNIFSLNLNFEDSHAIKTVGVKFVSTDPNSLLLDMEGASLPKDERVTQPHKHEAVLPPSYCTPEDTYQKRTNEGIKTVKWENMLNKEFKFSINEDPSWSTLNITQPLALYIPLDHNKVDIPKLLISITIDGKKDDNCTIDPTQYCGKKININIKNGSVETIHGTSVIFSRGLKNKEQKSTLPHHFFRSKHNGLF